MNVLFISYPDVALGKGGMYQQIRNTKESLEAKGVNVIIHDFMKTSLEGIDVCHVFALNTLCVGVIEYCLKSNIPIVISTVFNRFDRSSIRIKIEMFLARNIPGFFSSLKIMERMLCSSKYVFALNNEEQILLTSHFPSCKNKIMIIPNGIDARLLPDKKIKKSKQIVLNVGEVCPRKNQLNLIKAAADASWELIIVGPIPDNEYTMQCVEQASKLKNTTLMGELPYGSQKLKDLYADAKVFCLPSFSEVQPLTLIEAAAHNCNLVVSNQFPTQDFLKDLTIYVEPGSPVSIKHGIEQALKEEGFAYECIQNEKTWCEIADLLIGCYERAIIDAKA